MEVQEGRVKFDNHRVAHSQARQHFNSSVLAIGENSEPLAAGDLQVPQNVFDYFFKLQVQVEDGQSMDYHIYANRMWDEMFGPAETESDQQARSFFENSMIAGLYSIDMKDLVYPHVTENLEALIGVRGDEIRELVLWSTGDVAASGYQSAKIERSGIIKKYMKALRNSVPDQFREQMGKTGYMVDDDKFERLVDRVEQMNPEEKTVNLVIIEDSIKNFDKVKQALKDRYGEDILDRVKVIPIWAAYSREGQTARKKAGESPQTKAEYDRKTEGLHVIDSFAQLLDQERFGELFKDAHVFVDFDGVIGDNIAMRNAQAKTIYQALIAGGNKKGMDITQIEVAIQNVLEAKE